jgi:DNA polymerase-3 subunit alpha
MNSVEEHTGLKLEWREFDHDPRVYTDILDKDLATGLFQLSGGAVRSVIKQIRSRSIHDIAIHVSLMRPGAMDAPSPDPKDPATVTAADYFLQCRQGEREAYYIHPDLKEVLGDTYGIIVTQEQALKIFRVFADYTYETAEDVRRAIGKKIEELLAKHSAVLKEKLLLRGWTEEQAKRLYDSVVASARYSFNMSHAVAYAIVAYNGAWLKLNYPVHYWKGELTVHSRDHAKLREYLIECRDYVLDIDILKSDPVEWLVEDGKLRPPLRLMKGCRSVYTSNLKRFMAGEWDKVVEEVPEETEETVEVLDAVE